MTMGPPRKNMMNNYRSTKIDDGFLVTTDHGSWTFLNDKDFSCLQSGSIPKPLSKKLEEKGILVTENNIAKIKGDLARRYSYLRQSTSLHIVVVTLRCNQHCLYCHASSRPLKDKSYDMDIETARKTVEFIFQSPSNSITIEFQGGEPLLNFKAIQEIVLYAKELNKKHKKNLLFQLVTNLTLMDQKILDYCIENDIGICTSLDGPRELHDYNRGFCRSSHSDVVKWISNIQEEYRRRNIHHTKSNALVTITKRSLRYPKEIVDEYLKNNLEGVHLRYMNKLGYAAKNKKEIEYEAEEFISFWKKAIDHIIEINKKGIKFEERGAVIILSKILGKHDPNYLDMRSPCGAAIGQMAYNYNGEIFCCDEGRTIKDDLFRIGDVRKNRFKEVILSENCASIVSASINDTEICSLCAFKPYCGLCPVCMYAEQGNLAGIVPQATFCKVYKAQFEYMFEKYIKDKDARKVFRSWVEHLSIPLS